MGVFVIVTRRFSDVLAKLHFAEWITPFAIMMGLAFSYAIWINERTNIENDHYRAFEYQVKEVENTLTKRLHEYEHALIGLENFYRASEFVTDDEFQLYVSALIQETNYPELVNIGFAKYVNQDSPESFIALGRDASVLEKQLRDSPHEAIPIIYVAPTNAENRQKRLMNLMPLSQLHSQLSASFYRSLDASLNSLTWLSESNTSCECLLLTLPIYEQIKNSKLHVRSLRVNGFAFIELAPKLLFKSLLAPYEEKGILFKLTVGAAGSQDVNTYNSDGFKSTFDLKAHYRIHKKVKLLNQTVYLEVVQQPIRVSRSVDYTAANKSGLLAILASAGLVLFVQLISSRLKTLELVHQINQKLNLSEQRWKFALEGAGDGVWDWDLAQGTVVFSKRWKEMLGYREHELEDSIKTWISLVHPDDYPQAIKILNETLKGNRDHYAQEYRMLCQDGTWKWILDRGMVINRDAEYRPLRMVGTHADVTSLKASEEAIWQHANFDALTHLPNRRLFYSKIQEAITDASLKNTMFALLFLDLDRFKEVNDSQGHDQGDLLLIQAGKRLKEVISETDVVARLGGDEFIVLLRDIHLQQLERINVTAEKIILALNQPFNLTNHTAYISASLGIALFPVNGQRIEDLMKSVDQAMYASKQKGGGCFTYFTRELQDQVQTRITLSNDLRTALSHQELLIEYQPIIDLKTSKIHKAEALIRWNHPLRGRISPAEFIPIAEDNHTIIEIGNWIIEQALEQAAQWREQIDKHFQISVNMSAIQFHSDNTLATHWLHQIETGTSNGDSIVVEITESLLLDASEKVSHLFGLFQTLGIQVALDDFGTGYSSLAYLKKFDIDYLKIDRAFVSNLSDGSNDFVLCEAIIMMAHRLGIKVIAEGVETIQQRDLLIKAGCDYGQGYLFSKPIAAESFLRFALGHQDSIHSNNRYQDGLV